MTCQDKGKAFEQFNRYPPGTASYLAATLSMVIAHGFLLVSLYVLFVMPLPGHEESAGVIMLVAAISLFLIIHPSFLIMRGRDNARRLLRLVSAAYGILLAAICAWSLIHDELLSYYCLPGAVLSWLGFAIYSGEKIADFQRHFARVWGRE